MPHATKIYSYCRYETKPAKKAKFSLVRDLKLNGIFYAKCILIASMMLLIMRGFLGI